MVVGFATRPQGSTPGTSGGSKRSGFSHGCPSGRTPNCSKISRSKAWMDGHSAASEGQEAPTRQESEAEPALGVVGQHRGDAGAVAVRPPRSSSRPGRRR